MDENKWSNGWMRINEIIELMNEWMNENKWTNNENKRTNEWE